MKVTGTAFSISYAGADVFDHGYVLNINGKTFVHDSLYLFKKSNSDTTWLPTKKYVVVKSENGRILYDYITPFSILMKINDKLANDTSIYFLDASKLFTKGELIVNLKPSGVVEFSKNYPLRIQPINEK